MRSKLFPAVSVLLLAMLAVTGCTKFGARSDAQVTSDVQSKINSDSNIQTKQISVAADKGVVTLSGTVASDMERMAAANDASQIEGVKTVVNNLQTSNASTSAPQSASSMDNMAGMDMGTPAPTSAPHRPLATRSSPARSSSTKPSHSYSDETASNAPSSTRLGDNTPAPPPAPVTVTVPGDPFCPPCTSTRVMTPSNSGCGVPFNVTTRITRNGGVAIEVLIPAASRKIVLRSDFAENWKLS